MFNSEKKILISKFFKAYKEDCHGDVQLKWETNVKPGKDIEDQKDHRVKLYEDIQSI